MWYRILYTKMESTSKPKLTAFTVMIISLSFTLFYVYQSSYTVQNVHMNSSMAQAMPDAEDILPNHMDDFIIPDDGVLPLTLHLMRFYSKPPEKPASNLCWLECVSLLSMLMYVQPRQVYIHTNYPDFWPLDACHSLISDWSSIKMIYQRRRFHVGGRLINPNNDRFIAHEADVAKLVLLHKYGGMASDLDIFYLPNIQKTLSQLVEGYSCVGNREYIAAEKRHKMNMGFLACHKNSQYVADILQKYKEDYKTNNWVFNSGEYPWEMYSKSLSKYKTMVYIDDHISNNPSWSDINKFLNTQSGMAWENKPAFHSFYHNCTYNELAASKKDTSFASLLSSILVEAKKHVKVG